ncbi:MAG: hypothetical protein PHR96_01435 [Clostridia bacterium]|nr:hypothetical protein [Clostridia bacterium]
MSLFKKVFNFIRQPEPGPSLITIDFPAPDWKGIDWIDANRPKQLKTLVDENWTELIALVDFIGGHIVKNHGLAESVHLDYQKKCKETLLNKGFVTDVRKFELLEEIVKTIESLDFDKYPQTVKNLQALVEYISAPNGKGLFLCQRGVWLRERPNVEGAVVTILRERDNPNFVFDENNQFIKDWGSNYQRLYNKWTDWQSKLHKAAAEEERNKTQFERR